MAGLSADVYDNANKPSVGLQNPLDVYAKAGQVAAGMNANKLFQAQQLRGQLAQQAIDPQTGQYDPAKANALIAGAGPGVAQAAPEAIGQNQALVGAQQNQGIQRSQYAAAAIAPLLKLPDDQLHDGMVTTLHRAIDEGIMTGPEATKLALSFSNDPNQLRTQLEQTRIRLLSPEGAQTAIYGQPGTQNDGSRIVGTNQSVQSGAISTPPQQGVPLGLSPGERATQVPGVPDANGVPQAESLQQRLQRQGQQDLITPGKGPSPFGTGAFPNALRNTPAAAAAPPGGAPSAGPVPVGQSPAQIAAQTETGGSSAKTFADISNQATAAQSRGAILDNMLSDTSQFTTGPLAARKEKLRALAGQFGIPIDTEKLSASEGFNKLAAQLATASNPGSDARLGVTQAANPHAELSPGGIDLMVRQLRGNEDYNIARAKLAASYSNTADLRGFNRDIGSNLDPRVFQYARMSPEQKATYFKAVGDKAQFKKAYGWATQQGLLGGGNAGQ